MSLSNRLFDMSSFRRIAVVEFETNGAVASAIEFEDNKPRLLGYQVIDNCPYPDPTIVSHLRDFVQAYQLGGCSAVVVMPGQWVYPRFVSLPPVSDDKIVQIVKYEAQQNIPFPIDDVVWDYAMLDKKEPPVLPVLLVAIKDDVIEECFSVLRECGLRPRYADISSLCIANVIKQGSQPPTVIVSMGSSGTDVVLVEDQQIFFRQIPIGVETAVRDLTIAGMDRDVARETIFAMKLDAAKGVVAPTMVKLNAEIMRTINFYRSQQDGTQPTVGVAAGMLSSLGLVDSLLRDIMNLPAISSIDADVEGAFSGGNKSELWRTDAGRLVGAAGIALRESKRAKYEISLVPKSIIRQKERIMKAAKMTLTLTPLAMIAVAGIFYALTRPEAPVLASKSLVSQIVEPVESPAIQDDAMEIVTAISMASAGAKSPVASFDRGSDGKLVRAIVSGNFSDANEAIKYADRLLAAWPGCKMTLALRPSVKEGCHCEVTLTR